MCKQVLTKKYIVKNMFKANMLLHFVVLEKTISDIFVGAFQTESNWLIMFFTSTIRSKHVLPLTSKCIVSGELFHFQK